MDTFKHNTDVFNFDFYLANGGDIFIVATPKHNNFCVLVIDGPYSNTRNPFELFKQKCRLVNLENEFRWFIDEIKRQILFRYSILKYLPSDLSVLEKFCEEKDLFLNMESDSILNFL